MEGLEDVNEFIRLSQKVETDRDLYSLLESVSREMGFFHFSLIQQDETSTGRDFNVAISNYPINWIEQILDKKYYMNDPILAAGQRAGVGFRWDEVEKIMPLSSWHKTILGEARKAGLSSGFTVPSHVPNRATGIASFAVKGENSLPEKLLPMAQLVGSFALEAARKLSLYRNSLETVPAPVKLTSRQAECVLFVARGKTDWEISRILGVSEETVTEHVNNARLRYESAKRSQLVLRALADGHFTLNEALF